MGVAPPRQVQWCPQGAGTVEPSGSGAVVAPDQGGVMPSGVRRRKEVTDALAPWFGAQVESLVGVESLLKGVCPKPPPVIMGNLTITFQCEPKQPTQAPPGAGGIWFALGTRGLCSCWPCTFHVVCVNFVCVGYLT